MSKQYLADVLGRILEDARTNYLDLFNEPKAWIYLDTIPGKPEIPIVEIYDGKIKQHSILVGRQLREPLHLIGLLSHPNPRDVSVEEAIEEISNLVDGDNNRMLDLAHKATIKYKEGLRDPFGRYSASKEIRRIGKRLEMLAASRIA